MKPFRIFVFLVTISLVFSLSACNQSATQTSGRLRVLTTIAPLYSFTKNVAGDTADVENLIPSGAGPHEYSLSPADVRKVAETQVLIINGVNLEEWLNSLITAAQEYRESSGTRREKLIIVDTSRGIDIRDGDPHIWLSPKNAIIQVKNIRDALMAADPDNSRIYAKNADAYIQRLESLDIEIKNGLAAVNMKSFVAFHPAFAYFARDYGLRQAAVIQESPETGPSPQHIAEVIGIIKSQGIKSIFTMPRSSHKIVTSIAGDLGLQVYGLDTLETGTLSGTWYEDSMRSNARVLIKALQ